MLENMCETLCSNSLPAERAHATIKKGERSKLTQIAVASRNQIAMQFLKWREKQCLLLQDQQKALRRQVYMSSSARVWQREPASRPHGVRIVGTSDQPQAGEEPGAGDRDADADTAAEFVMGEYMLRHREELEKERQEDRRKAEAKLQKLLSSFSVPVTRPQWEVWLKNNLQEFRTKIRTAAEARREYNVRLRARSGLPDPVKRIGPAKKTGEPFQNVWAKRLANRAGWH